MEISKRRLLLISNSTLYGGGYLDHAEAAIREFLGTPLRLLLFPMRSSTATRMRGWRAGGWRR